MSKTYRANTDITSKKQYHHVHHQAKHKNKIDVIKKNENHGYGHLKFDEFAFFKEIAPLANFVGVFTEKEHKILVHWMDHAQKSFSDEDFTTSTLMRFIMKINGMAKLNPRLHEEFSKYCYETPSFCTIYLDYTKNIFDHLTSSELRKILTFMAHMHLYPDDNWFFLWLEKTESLLAIDFSGEDLIHSLEQVSYIHRIQGFSINNAWMRKWFAASELHIETMSSEHLCHMLSLIGIIGNIPSSRWIDTCMKRSSEFFEGFTGIYLFQFENAFSLEAVRHQEDLVAEWLKLSLAEMKTADASAVARGLLTLVYHNISIPTEWLNAWMEKVCGDFELVVSNPIYSTLNLSYILYALALMQQDVASCRPLLEKCNEFFKNHEKTVFNRHGELKLRKIAFAKNYFELMGFSLCVDPKDYPDLLSKLNNMLRSGSNTQSLFAENLKRLFGISIEEEADIPVIIDSVDFFVRDKNLIIEVDGPHHFIDGQQNPLTRVKTFMLEKSGYKVKRFTVGPNIKNLLGFLKTELAEYL